MKFVLRVLLLLLLTYAPADAAIALVQHTNFNQTSNVSSQALAYGSNNASGGFGAVCIRAGNKSTVLSVTDNNSNTWASVVSVQITGTGNGELLQCFEAHNLNAGANTVTVSTTISTTLRFALFEYSGCATTSPIDGTNSNVGSSASLASNSITPSANNELVISAGSVDAAETYTAGASFTMEEVVPAAPSKLGVEDWIQTTATTTTGPMTISGSDSWGAVVFAVKVSGGAAAPLKPPVLVKGESHESENGIRTSVRFDGPAYLDSRAELQFSDGDSCVGPGSTCDICGASQLLSGDGGFLDHNCWVGGSQLLLYRDMGLICSDAYLHSGIGDHLCEIHSAGDGGDDIDLGRTLNHHHLPLAGPVAQ